MDSITALATLLGIYTLGELIAKKTKAVFSTVLGVAVILLVGFWSGLIPASIFDDAKVTDFGNVVAGLMIVSLGTTIDFAELKRQWKIVVTALVCVLGAVGCIYYIGPMLIERQMAISGAPIFAGGSAATLIMISYLKEHALTQAVNYCIALYVTQKFIGIPIASYFLRQTAKKMIKIPELIEEYKDKSSDEKKAGMFHILQLPKFFDKASVYIVKIALVAVIAFYGSKMTGGTVHYFVMCLIMGIVFFMLGFLEKGIMKKTDSGGLITFFVTILIFSNLSTITPSEVLEVIYPLIISAVLGVTGVCIAGVIFSKILNLEYGLAISVGISCTFGFPTTMLIPQEVSEAIGSTDDEKTAILNYLLPKMLTAGFITVTIISVLVAGVAVNLL